MAKAKKAAASAADFLSSLIHTSYLPAELPPAITARWFSDFCKNNYSFLNSQKALIFKSNTQYVNFSAPRQKAGRRNLAVVHPLGQLAVSLAIAEHRTEIEKLINRSGLSLYQTEQNLQHNQLFRGLDFRKWKSLRQKVQSEYPFVLNADISNFFYAIYTHSIPWAAIGKEQAKLWHQTDPTRLNSHWSSDLDKAIQCCQSRETFGIPVGPDTSRVIAELLMAGIEAEPALNGWLRGRVAFRLIDDFTVGFDNSSDAYQALGALRTSLWKYNLRLNDEKTNVVQSLSPLRAKWEVEHEGFVVSDIIPSQQAKDILRFLDLTLHYCIELRSDLPAFLTCRRISRLKNTDDNFLLILDVLFRLAREYPRCISLVVAFLINNRTRSSLHKRRVEKWVRAIFAAHSMHGHDFEVAWCLVACGALKIRVRKLDIRTAGDLPGPLVLSLLGLLHERKLLSVPLSRWPWRAEFKKNGIYTQNWLPFYEAVRRGWTKDKALVSAIKNNVVLSKMLSKKVSFLEDRIFDAAFINTKSRTFSPSSSTTSSSLTKVKKAKKKLSKGFGGLEFVKTDWEY